MTTSLRTFCAFFLLLASLLFGGAALADTPVYTDINEDGSVTELYYDKNGQVYAIFYNADGTVSGTNPNPDGDGKGTARPDYKDIVKKLAALKGGLRHTSKNDLFNTVLKGKGIVPVWQPADLAAKTGDTGAGGAAEQGRTAESLKNAAKHGAGSGGSTNGARGAGGDVNGHKAPDNSSGYKIKPELVNPAPK